MNILVVDSDWVMAKQIAQKIKQWGHHTEKYVTGNQALGMVKAIFFDLALVDIFHPGTRSDELIPRIKRLWLETGIITMTGFNSRELEKKTRRQGIQFYLIKPFEMNHLETLVDHCNQKRVNN